MQPMQDKDLDQLFRNVFADAEAPAPTNGWSGIAKKLDKPNKNRPVLFWMAATMVGALLTITLVFNQEEKIQLRAPQIALQPPVPLPVVAPTKEYKEVPKRYAEEKVSERKRETIEPAKAAQTPEEVLAQVVHDAPVQTVENERPTVPVSDGVIYAQLDPVTPSGDTVDDSDQPENRIRNVGDLVNLVIGKVDKREKKLLRFNTTDDDSSLIGLNIGFLKFNSKKHK